MSKLKQIRLDPDVAKEVEKFAKVNFRSASKEASERLRWLYAILNGLKTKQSFPTTVDEAMLNKAINSVK